MKQFLPASKDLTTSAGIIIFASVILGSMALLWGLHVAAAGYIAMLFLSPTLGKLPLKHMGYSLLWLLGLSVLGLVVAPLGELALLGTVVFAAVMQGFFVFGTGTLLNRSPTTVVALSLTHHDLIWQPFLGVLVGGAVVVAVGALAFRNPKIQQVAPLSTRLTYGGYLAIGAAVITLIWQTLDLDYLAWALILFCLMFTFERHDVIKQLRLRAGGALTGAVIALCLALVLPRNALIVVAIAFAILEIAYLAENQIFLRMVFLTGLLLFISVIMSTTDPQHEVLHRVYAIVAPTIVALLLHFLVDKLRVLLRDTKLASLERELKQADEHAPEL